MWMCNVIVYRGLAYVPVVHALSTGGWYTGEPVTVVPVTVEDVARALSRVRKVGNPPISAAKVAISADPILRSTGAPTWGRLALHAASYEIDWSEESALLRISRLDERGRFVDDPAKEKRYPADVASDELAAAIVQDWQSRQQPV